MDGPSHYAEAERLLESCQLPGFASGEVEQYPEREDGVDSIGNALVAAQVHATLALAAATAMNGMYRMDDDDFREWDKVAGVQPDGDE